MSIRVAETDQEIGECYPVMRQLRPHLTPESFLERVRFQERLGYCLVYLKTDGGPVAVAGFQIRETLVDGRFLHVDDLVTLDAERSQGHGAELIRWLARRSRELSCTGLQLDSGVQRKDAHRFYEREGLNVTACHFELPVHASPA